jgi:oligopeptide/dipeptide ABC transporter ATP-binding protein
VNTEDTPIIEVRGLSKYFSTGRRLFGTVSWLRAVQELELAVYPGRTFALVGESGCGKSTTARLLLALQRPSRGTVLYKGVSVQTMTPAQRRAYRAGVQVVFQDSNSSLNPRKTIGGIVERALGASPEFAGRGRQALRDAAVSLLEDVGLSPAHAFMGRYPHELSGGQRQRVGIARALAPNPELIVADEPVSALDISIRAQIIELLERIQRERGVAFLFISHDLSVVRTVAHVIGVMYLGRLIEYGPVDRVFATPVHPYTEVLINATPIPDPRLARERRGVIISGDVPSPVRIPDGCAFHPRCPLALDRCRTEVPEARVLADGRSAACHRAEERLAGLPLDAVNGTGSGGGHSKSTQE